MSWRIFFISMYVKYGLNFRARRPGLTVMKSSNDNNVTVIKLSNDNNVPVMKSSNNDEVTVIKSSNNDDVTVIKSSNNDGATVTNLSNEDDVMVIKPYGWSVFYCLRNDSPANACCRRCASLQKQECAAPYRYCRGLEMTLCTWARLYVGKFSDMQNMNIYFHCFIYSLWSGSHLTTRTEIRWPWVAPTWYLNWLQYQSRYFGSTIPCLGKLVDH